MSDLSKSDECSESPVADSSQPTTRLLENPYDVISTVTDAVVGRGVFSCTAKMTATTKGMLEWERWDCPAFHLERAGQLHIVQGGAIGALFQLAKLLSAVDQTDGPFFLLSASMETLWSTKLTKLTLGRITKRPDDVPVSIALFAMVEEVTR